MRNNLYIFIIVVFVFTISINILKAVEELYILNITVETKIINGNQVEKFLINNSDKAPIIKAKLGDKIKIIINNNGNTDMVMHWHGVIVPNSQDGVAGVTQPTIKAKTSYTYKFEVKQTGTYWYHAHGFEEAQGIYGGIIFNDSNNSIEEGTLLLYSGILDKNPEQVFADLKGNVSNVNSMMPSSHNMGGGHEMSMNSKKDNTNSIIKDNSHKILNYTTAKQTKALNSKPNKSNKQMMHFSDVNFYTHSINSETKEINVIPNKNKQQVKLRIVNTYIDGFLNFVYSGGYITIVASDGIDVMPLKVKNLRVAMGETYDILLDIPNNNMSYELVSFILGTKEYNKVVINQGEKVTLLSYDYKDYSQEQPYQNLESKTPNFINFIPSNNNAINFNWNLIGNHSSYNWYIQDDGTKKIIDSIIKLPVGSKVKIKIKNNTMMPHPMHLHGMFFKIVNVKNNLIKHTYNLDPMETVEIEFIVDAEGKWLFHCHNLFHMASGMMITFDVSK